MSYKDLAIRYFREILEEGNLEVIDEIFHPNYSSDMYYGDPHNFGSGIPRLKKRMFLWVDTFSEKYLLKQIMENDIAVFCEYIVTTKQKKTWFDKNPKDKTARVEGFVLLEIKENKIYSIKGIFDYEYFWAQLGYQVDRGDYQLPAFLKIDNIEKIQLKQLEIKKLETDFSILHSSVNQYKNLIQYSNYIRHHFEVDDKAIRAITISSVIEWQKEFNKHQIELIGSLPQELMKNAIWILERGKQKFKNLLLNDDDVENLDSIFNNLIDFFAKEFSK